MASSTVVELSRWQFAITAIFHMTFPALTVGLSVLLAVVYTVYVRTGNPLYLQIFRFWKKIFAVGFGLGVVAGTPTFPGAAVLAVTAAVLVTWLAPAAP